MKQTIDKGLFIDLCQNQMSNPFSVFALESIFDYLEKKDPNMEFNVSDIENDFVECFIEDINCVELKQYYFEQKRKSLTEKGDYVSLTLDFDIVSDIIKEHTNYKLVNCSTENIVYKNN